jgi:hypothetical protein
MHNINYINESVPADLTIMISDMVRERSYRSLGKRSALLCRPEIIKMLTFRTT